MLDHPEYQYRVSASARAGMGVKMIRSFPRVLYNSKKARMVVWWWWLVVVVVVTDERPFFLGVAFVRGADGRDELSRSIDGHALNST